jgi:DNA-3-methyladenine glycosylase
MGPRLRRDFYARDTETVARDLLGKHLVHVVDGIERRGRIVEVEAYVGAHDLAAHSSKGITPRTRTMYGPPGHAYVYLIYGIHHCLNLVTEPEGNGAAVLLRALEPVAGITGNTRGPGLLCRALGIDRSLNGVDLEGDVLFVEAPLSDAGPLEIVAAPRVGVDYAGEWAGELLRFYLGDSLWVSRR